MIPKQKCKTCKQTYPATRQHFPPHKDLAFERRPCKSCRAKVYAKQSNETHKARDKARRLEVLESDKLAVTDPVAWYTSLLYKPLEHEISGNIRRIMKRMRITLYNDEWLPKGQAALLWLQDHKGYEDKKLYQIREAMLDDKVLVSETTVLGALRKLHKV